MPFEIEVMEFLDKRTWQRAGESSSAAIDGGGNNGGTARMISVRPCVLPFGGELRPTRQILSDSVLVGMAYGIG